MPKLDVRLIFIICQSILAHDMMVGAQMPRGG